MGDTLALAACWKDLAEGWARPFHRLGMFEMSNEDEATTEARKNAHPGDEADIARSVQGDGEAFGGLIRRYQNQVAADLSRFTSSRLRVEELTQDVFIEAYNSLRTYRGEGPFGHWLRKITVRVGYGFLRKTIRDRAQREDAMPDHAAICAPSPNESDPAEAAAQVQAALEKLPPRDRLVLTLMYLEDLSIAEIAERTGWSRIMVKVQAFRARRKLRRLLEAEESEP